mmetsp:Transcript_2819/g.6859  ORF Transcript_2819/g.6859 Transcript_2819/m.6859 type:complete len:300 (-) Transcript_2819:1807-2706(-)
MGLSREVDEERQEVLRGIFLEPQRDVDRLTRPSVARHDNVLVLQNQSRERVGQADRVHSGYHNVLILRPRGDSVLRCEVQPLGPATFPVTGDLVDVVVPKGLVGKLLVLATNLDTLLANHLPKGGANELTAVVVTRRTNAPHQGEKEQGGEMRQELRHLVSAGSACLGGNVVEEIAIQKPEVRLHHIVVDGHGELLALAADDDDQRQRELEHQVLQQVLVLLLEGRGQALDPRLDQGLVPESGGLHVDHAATADCRRGGNAEVLHLEHHPHLRGQSDDLARGETELFVVIEHCVHGLDP